MNSCPPRDRLELLLVAGLLDTGARRDRGKAYVEDCADCQRTLDELTGATVWGPKPRPEAAAVDPPDVTVVETASGANGESFHGPSKRRHKTGRFHRNVSQDA